MGHNNAKAEKVEQKQVEAETSMPVGNFNDDYFTDYQKVLLRKTWVFLEEDAQEKGIRVFARIFYLCPSAKQLFPFRNKEGEELLRHPLFRGHGMRFMKAVGGTIHNIDTLDLIVMPNLIQLGKSHINFTGFTLDHLDVFVEAMDYVWAMELGKYYNAETRSTWQILFNLIVSKLAEGYNAALENKAPSVVANDHQSASGTTIPGYNQGLQLKQSEEVIVHQTSQHRVHKDILQSDQDADVNEVNQHAISQQASEKNVQQDTSSEATNVNDVHQSAVVVQQSKEHSLEQDILPTKQNIDVKKGAIVQTTNHATENCIKQEILSSNQYTVVEEGTSMQHTHATNENCVKQVTEQSKDEADDIHVCGAIPSSNEEDTTRSNTDNINTDYKQHVVTTL